MFGLSLGGGQCVVSPVGGKGGIWISGIDFAQDEAELTRNGIKAIVSAVDLDLGLSKSFKIIRFKLDDSESQQISQHFDECFEFIERNLPHTNVLVHCAAGISRSSAMLISYLMKKHKLSFEKAFELVRSKRSCCYPNHGFQAQLRKYQARLKSE